MKATSLKNLKYLAGESKIGATKGEWGVNGSKTELILLKLEKNISVPILNNEVCAITRVTKSLGLLIDDKLSYNDHAERVCNKAKRSWDIVSSVLGCEWSLTLSALVPLYKTIIIPQLLYASAKWFEKNRNYVLRIQNRCTRTIFRHSFSPTISTCETLLGTPPIDLYKDAIEGKIVIKVIKAKDLVSNTHLLFRHNGRSKSAALESKLFNFRKFLDDETMSEYSKREIHQFIEHKWIRRCSSLLNEGLMQHLPNTQPQVNTCCPLITGDPYIANKICELVIGYSFAFAEYSWKMWKCESSLCMCGKCEDNLYHFFFCCPLYNERPPGVATRNLMTKTDCEQLRNYILNANKLNILIHELLILTSSRK